MFARSDVNAIEGPRRCIYGGIESIRQMFKIHQLTRKVFKLVSSAVALLLKINIEGPKC